MAGPRGRTDTNLHLRTVTHDNVRAQHHFSGIPGESPIPPPEAVRN
jgi:hypothetical protein